jgi:hypothetical protein
MKTQSRVTHNFRPGAAGKHNGGGHRNSKTTNNSVKQMLERESAEERLRRARNADAWNTLRRLVQDAEYVPIN